MQEGEVHRREVVHDRPEFLVGREEFLERRDLLAADVPGVGRAPQGDGQLPARVLRPPVAQAHLARPHLRCRS